MGKIADVDRNFMKKCPFPILNYNHSKGPCGPCDSSAKIFRFYRSRKETDMTNRSWLLLFSSRKRYRISPLIIRFTNNFLFEGVKQNRLAARIAFQI